MIPEDVSVRARFERFPATVKGAFVLRGEDANPHLIEFNAARIVSLVGTLAPPIAMKPVVLDIPPHQDVFLPFEFGTTELEAGWYGLECDVSVDGGDRTYPGGRRFVVSWPRATVRRGTVPVGDTLRLGSGLKVTLGAVECSGEQAVLKFGAEPSEPVSVQIHADGNRLQELESEFDMESGQGRVAVYPVMRAHEVLRIEAVGDQDVSASAIEVPLR